MKVKEIENELESLMKIDLRSLGEGGIQVTQCAVLLAILGMQIEILRYMEEHGLQPTGDQ